MSTTPPPPPPSDPYRPPQVPAVAPTPTAAAEVSGPATGLLITAILGGAIQILSLMVNMLGIGLGSITAGDSQEQLINWISGGFGMISSAVGLVIAGIIIYAALEMKKLKQWNLAIGASILAMVPCISPCCFVGLPIGIWSLVVLVKQEIKAAFS